MAGDGIVRMGRLCGGLALTSHPYGVGTSMRRPVPRTSTEMLSVRRPSSAKEGASGCWPLGNELLTRRSWMASLLKLT